MTRRGLILRTFGLSGGIIPAVLLNLPFLQWKTTIPMTIFALLAVFCLIWSLFDKRA